jgi:hypothetical protein
MSEQAQRLELPRRRVPLVSMSELGYPAVRFRYKVESKAMSRTWNRRERDG